MTVGRLKAALAVDDHGRHINVFARVRLSSSKRTFDILSVYPSEDGKTLWIDIEADPFEAGLAPRGRKK